MRSRLLFTLALVLFPLAASSSTSSPSSSHPAPRNYDTHHYYSLETSPNVTPEQAKKLASEVGAEWVERIGQLDGHWLVRSEKERTTRRDGLGEGFEHAVIRRWKEKERRSKSMGQRRKGHGLKGRSGAGHDLAITTRIKDISHLPIRQRVKRQHSPSPVTSDPPQNLTELNYVQTQLGLADPLLPSQWHLVNTQLPEVELNVTGAWGEGITGQGVTVAIIDDGLDMDSDDLAGNFVSTGIAYRHLVQLCMA